MRLTWLLVAGAAAVALLAAGANALPGDAFFPGGQGCYSRSYSAIHLAAHPVQTVRWMALSPDPDIPPNGQLVLSLSIAVKGDKEVFRGVAYCEGGTDRLSCGMEGDAGAFTLRRGADRGLLLEVDAGGVSFEGGVGFVTLSGRTGDDRLFRLSPGCV